MSCGKKADPIIDGTSGRQVNQRQAILERLWVRNAIRRELELIPLDIAELYHRKTEFLRGRSDRAPGMVLQQ